MKKIILLGASGSIGSQTLDVMSENPSSFQLVSFSVGHNVERVHEIIKMNPSVARVCVISLVDKERLTAQYPNIQFFCGDSGLLRLVEESRADMVVNALVGFVGFLPTIAALNKNLIVCLANKESLVVGGEIINRLLNEGKGRLYPIDSEHVALSKCLTRVDKNNVKYLILTASGGAFRNLSREELSGVTKDDALQHPTWKMGPKITIDSATMMNKGFEVIEAYYLFGFEIEKIKILMHGESKVHSLIQLNDNSYVADIGAPDMHIPIRYALFEGNIPFDVFRGKELKDLGDFTFKDFDSQRYPCVGYAFWALSQKGIMPCVLNAANEEAVYAFLHSKISFLKIEDIIKKALAHFQNILNPTPEIISKVDEDTRLYVRSLLEER